jgi:membrane protease YdiL (CAAX protease family)
MVPLALFGIGIDIRDLPFPIALISLPINETILLGITLLFARYKNVSLRELGLKKVSFRILGIVSVLAVFLFLLGLSISICEEIVYGPDPMAEAFSQALIPKDFSQLTILIVLSLVLVGPAEELAFRGFLQKGFENSFGKIKGLLAASVLFGVLHGLNTLYAIIPAFIAGLVLGYVWQRTDGSTTASALMHGINNSISIAIAYFATV